MLIGVAPQEFNMSRFCLYLIDPKFFKPMDSFLSLQVSISML